MAKRKITSRVTIRKHIHVGTVHYPPLDSNRYGPVREVPYIRLRGRWLVAAGFAPNDLLDVRAENGRIVITRV